MLGIDGLTGEASAKPIRGPADYSSNLHNFGAFLYGESNKSVVNIGFGEGKLKLMKRLGPAPRSAGEVKSCAAALEE